MQNVRAGAPIKKEVRKRELTSGPKISLPPQKNLWCNKSIII